MMKASTHSVLLLASALLSSAVVFGCGASWTLQQETGLRGDAEVTAGCGLVDGYLQTPRGGRPGSSSRKRPTLDELGIDAIGSGELRGSLGWGAHALSGSARITPISRQRTLGSSLVSQNTVFPQGAPVDLKARLDLYRIGYRYRLLLADGRGTTLRIEPEAGLLLFDFRYKLNDLSGGIADRSYMKGAIRLGTEILWNRGGRFSAGLRLGGSIPLRSAPFVLSAQGYGAFRLWRWAGSEGEAMAGVGGDHLDYKDGQELPNHIRATRAPFFFLGLRVRM